jgi:hypothetical protein
MLGAVHLIPFHGFYLTRILCDSLTPAYSCFDSLRTIKQGFEGRVSLSPHEEIYRTKQDTVATQALLLTLSQGMPYSPLCIHFQPAGGSQQGGRTAAAVTPPPHQQEQPPSSSSPGEVAPTLRRARALIPPARARPRSSSTGLRLRTRQPRGEHRQEAQRGVHSSRALCGMEKCRYANIFFVPSHG